jgi:hypothetical protein
MVHAGYTRTPKNFPLRSSHDARENENIPKVHPRNVKQDQKRKNQSRERKGEDRIEDEERRKRKEKHQKTGSLESLYRAKHEGVYAK